MFTTYLLGAGASKDAVPVVKDFNENFLAELRLYENTSRVSTINTQMGNTLSSVRLKDYRNTIQLINKSLHRIKKELSVHQTIDTLARRFSLTNDQLLIELKNLLSIYFWTKQFRGTKDNRYDFFLANILEYNEGEIKWPENIKIISWNYDLQLEIAISLYGKSGSVRQANKRLCSIPDINEPNKVDKEIKDINMIKLNGIAGLYSSENGESYFPFDEINISENSFYLTVLDFFKSIEEVKPKCHLNFAWENTDTSQKGIEKAAEILVNTDKLIVIGYSFPYYNRMIDSSILSNMNAGEVIIQDKFPANVSERFLSRVPQENRQYYSERIRKTDDTSNFKLPED
jgi:hypothetical protein